MLPTFRNHLRFIVSVTALFFHRNFTKWWTKTALTSKEKLKIKLLVYKLTIHVKKANRIWTTLWYVCLVNSTLQFFFIFKGIFDLNESHLKLTICSRHRDKFVIRGRSNRRIFTTSSEWSSNCTSVSGERGISSLHSRVLYQQTQVLLPAGCCEC